MTDREALLQGILDHRDADLPRMVYADWLEENRVSDVDMATAEFIRASCGPESNKAKAREWLLPNWQRLMPTFMNKWCRREMFGADYRVHKRKLAVTAKVWYSVNRELRVSDSWLYFDRGFVSRIWSPSYHVLSKTPPALLADQLLLNLLALPPTASPQLLRDRKFYQTEFAP